MAKSSDFRRKGNGGKIAGGGCLLLLGMVAIWWMVAQTPPAVRIPIPVMPNPNAFSTYLRASSQILEGKRIDNAAYTKETARAGSPVLTLADRESLAAENRPVLATVHLARDQPFQAPPIRSVYTTMPYLAKFRGLARFLAFDADFKIAKRDYAGATDSSLAAIKMGAQIPHGGPLIGKLVGIACEAIGRRPLSKCVNRLNAPEALSAARRLEAIRKIELTDAETLQEEKWVGQATLMELFRTKDPGLSLGMMSGGNTPSPPPVFARAATGLFYLVYSKQRIMNDYTTYMDAQIKRSKEPFGHRSPEPKGGDPLVDLLAPTLENFAFSTGKSRAQNGLLEIMFALRAFRIQLGRYPASLSELTPTILSTLPTDPFTANQPFQYRRDGGSYVLYSVGPDGKDDGGKAIDTGPSRSANKNERYFVKPESVGDIVAGKNMW